MKDEKYIIEETAIKSFLRVIKEHGYYFIFRNRVTNNGILKMFVHSQNHCENPFRSATNVKDLASSLNELSNNIGVHDRRNKYQYITMTVNHLLHFFVEPHGVKMDDLCLMGEEIFNLTCTTLYGDKFTKEQPVDSIDEINNPYMLKSKIFQDFVKAKQRGEIKCSFPKYWEMRKPELEEWLRKHEKGNDKDQATEFILDDEINNADDECVFKEEDNLGYGLLEAPF